MQQLTGLDASFLALETASTTGPCRRGVRAGSQRRSRAADPRQADRGARRAAAAGSGAAPQAAERAARPGPAVLDRRRGLRHRVPHPRDRAARAWLRRATHRAGRPAARPSARPQPAAVGDLPDHRAGQAAGRGLHQDSPRGDRRRVRRRAAHRAARPRRRTDASCPPASRSRRPGRPGRPAGRARGGPAGLAAGADGRASPTNSSACCPPWPRRSACWSAACSG